MQACRPQSLLAPLQVYLGVQLHQQSGSRFLIDQLNRLGFSTSYSEVLRFERSAAVTHGTEFPGMTSKTFIQFIGDNVDHNICTIDGKGTFHGMGMLAAATPRLPKFPIIIPRAVVNLEVLQQVGQVPFFFYNRSQQENSLVYKPIPTITFDDKIDGIDLLWHASWIHDTKRVGWSGFMQAIHHGSYKGASSIVFLPMIDYNPSDLSCVYTTLRFISDKARQHGMVPVVTFDQPLYMKAVNIINAEPADSPLKAAVPMIGGLHCRMSFLGAIGHLMTETGIKEVLECLYAGNTIKHILSGKAVSRAMRAHELIDSALQITLICKSYGFDCTDDIRASHQDFAEASAICMALLNEEVTLEDASNADVVRRIQTRMMEFQDTLQNNRTAKIWLQYSEMFGVLKKAIRAERTGNWVQYLQALSEMLPYFAAAGHNLYTKSVRIFLQQMEELKESNQKLYKDIADGMFVIRRSDRFWAGLSPDLVIEQVLMRSLKTSMGLTRGNGMSETQRLIWTMSMPV